MNNNEALRAAFTGAVSTAAVAELDNASATFAQAGELIEALLTASARVNRLLGDDAGVLLLGELRPVAGLLPLLDWTAGDAARLLLLFRALEHPDTAPSALVRAMFKGGDESERAALVRGLALLPEPEAHKPIALEAGRTNSLKLYAALALNNPYAACYYTEHEFNQVVLKSLFTGLNIGRTVGLVRRANVELSQMCRDYVEEREAAGRDVPWPLWLALAPFMDDRGEAQLVRFLEHPDRDHRYYTMVAACRLHERSDALNRALSERKMRETDPDILAVLNG